MGAIELKEPWYSIAVVIMTIIGAVIFAPIGLGFICGVIHKEYCLIKGWPY